MNTAAHRELEEALRARLSPALALEAFATHSAKPVFRAVLPDGKRFFVKVVKSAKGARQQRMLEELNLPFVPKIPHLFEWKDGRSIVCQEWLEGRHVTPEEMTLAQCDSLVAATLRLQSALRPSHEMVAMRDLPAAYREIEQFARRHPFMRPWLRSLLDIPEDLRTYPADALATIHGDQHYENYLFDGNAVCAILDLEAITRGLPCQDFAYIVIRRFYKAKLSAYRRRRLLVVFKRMLARPEFSPRERAVAVNMWRLVFAARRLAAHPRFGPVALLAWKRDLPLRKLLRCV